jgi:hypothetical protein
VELKGGLTLNEHACDQCEKTYKTRAGLWKHKKAKHSETETIAHSTSPEVEPIPPGSDMPIEEPPSGDTSPSWMNWDFGSSEDATDTIPFGFKSIVTPVPGDWGNMSKAQRQALENQNLGILKMGLSSIDVLLSKYGQAVTLDPDFEVKHSEDDKNLVANAQYRYLEEKGLFLTNYLSTGMIAGALSVWYVGSPTIRIRKNAKKKLFKGRGLLARLPLIGRLFKRKQDVHIIGQNVEGEVKVE